MIKMTITPNLIIYKPFLVILHLKSILIQTRKTSQVGKNHFHVNDPNINQFVFNLFLTSEKSVPVFPLFLLC